MRQKSRHFFVAFALCMLGFFTMLGLNRAATRGEYQSEAPPMFALQQTLEGLQLRVLDSIWLAPQAMLEEGTALAQRAAASFEPIMPSGWRLMRDLYRLGEASGAAEAVLSLIQTEE